MLPGLREKALPLQALSQTTGVPLFAQEGSIPLDDENMAWELAAVCVQHLNALGAYRAPSSSQPLSTFLAITAVR